MILDEDAAGGKEPMADLVRTEVEEEMERLTVLRAAITDEVRLRPSTFEVFLRSRKADLLRALDYYEKWLQRSMNSAQELGYSPTFSKSQRELELVNLARHSLAV